MAHTNTHCTDSVDEIDLSSYQRIRPLGKRKSLGGPKKSSKGGLPKSVVRVIKKQKEKGQKNERRFFQIMKGFRRSWNKLILRFDVPTIHDDEVLKVDAWCVLSERHRLKVQIKSSAKRARTFRRGHLSENFIVIVINDYITNEQVFSQFDSLFCVTARNLDLM
jgi:hypothetical protein